MPIEPRRGETRKEFVSRCIEKEIESGREQDQAAAICHDIWERTRNKKHDNEDKS